MRLFELTHKKTEEIKIVLAKHEFGAKWLAAGSKAKALEWECKDYPDFYRLLDGNRVQIRNPYTFLWEDAKVVANRNLILKYVGALVELKREGKLKGRSFNV